MRFPLPSDLSAPVSVIVILITTVLIVDPNLASAQKVIINIDGGWRFYYPNKSHLSCIHLISSQSLVHCQYSLQRLVWRRGYGQSEVLHQSQTAGKSNVSPPLITDQHP